MQINNIINVFVQSTRLMEKKMLKFETISMLKFQLIIKILQNKELYNVLSVIECYVMSIRKNMEYRKISYICAKFKLKNLFIGIKLDHQQQQEKCNQISNNKQYPSKIYPPQSQPSSQTPKKQENYNFLAFKEFLFFKPFIAQQYEYVFKFLYLMASVFSAVLLRKVYQFQVLEEFQHVRKGNIVDFLYYSLPFGVAFTVSFLFIQFFDLAIHYLLDGPCEKYFLTETKYEGKARHKRAYTLVKWSYSIPYYLISSLAGLYLIKDTTFFPTWLGGAGTCLNQFQNAPSLPESTHLMKLFYLFQFGKHFSRLFSHMFIKQEGNYYEYVLHHSLSTFLIFFSYLTNQWLVGIMVLICHDISDLFLIMARGYKDYKNYSKTLLKGFYVFAIISWVGGRLIVFPACCVYSSVFGAIQVQQNLTDLQNEVLMLPYRWMGFMLIFLLGLQLFWSYYIGKAFVEVNVSAKIASNTYQ